MHFLLKDFDRHDKFKVFKFKQLTKCLEGILLNLNKCTILAVKMYGMF